MKSGCVNFWRKRLFAEMQLERLEWEINGHGGVGCDERSQFTATRLFHDEMLGSCLATCKMRSAHEVPL